MDLGPVSTSLDEIGVFEDDAHAHPILALVRDICGWKASTFPGSQPVSLNRSNMQKVIRNPYVVCEKTDGVRYLLLAIDTIHRASNGPQPQADVSGLFLIGRNEKVQRVNDRLPLATDISENHHKTLLDGEMVLDEVLDEAGKRVLRRRYLIYDVISIGGDASIMKQNLLERLLVVSREVIAPLVQYLATDEGLAEKRSFDIFLKDFFEAWDIPYISEFASSLPHVTDGLIFTPIRQPYAPGTCADLLKWKPPHLNTVDFYTEVMYSAKRKTPIGVKLYCTFTGMFAFCGHVLAPYGSIYKELIHPSTGKLTDGLIVECSYVPEDPVYTFIPQFLWDVKSVEEPHRVLYPMEEEGHWVEGGWVAERIRSDKKTPNAHHVTSKVVESIEDGITFEELVQKFQSLKNHGKRSAANLVATQKN